MPDLLAHCSRGWAGHQTQGTNQMAGLVSPAHEGRGALKTTRNVHWASWEHGLLLDNRAPATSLLDETWKDNRRGDGALRTPPLYLHTGRRSSAPLWFQMEK